MMNEEELSLKVQKNWVRIKRETQTIREKLMDKLLEDRALTLDEMKEIKSQKTDDQFDFFLIRLIESRKCTLLLRHLEAYGRRQLCIAIRKTEISAEDFNTSTESRLHELKQKPVDHHFQSLSKELKDFHTEIGDTVSSMNQSIDEMGQRMEAMDTKMCTMVVKKKDSKKKSKGNPNTQSCESQKANEGNERLKKLVRTQSDEVVKLKIQLQAKCEEIKCLKKQLQDKESSNKNLVHLLQKSNDEKIDIQKKLYDSKQEQLDLGHRLLANEAETKQLREQLLVSLDTYSDGKQTGAKDNDSKTSSVKQPKQVTFIEDQYIEPTIRSREIQELKKALDNALEEKECVNKLIKLKNAEMLKLTSNLRAKTEERENLQRQHQKAGNASYTLKDQIRMSDKEMSEAKKKLANNMKEMEDLTEKLKPMALKINEISERLNLLGN